MADFECFEFSWQYAAPWPINLTHKYDSCCSKHVLVWLTKEKRENSNSKIVTYDDFSAIKLRGFFPSQYYLKDMEDSNNILYFHHKCSGILRIAIFFVRDVFAYTPFTMENLNENNLTDVNKYKYLNNIFWFWICSLRIAIIWV